MLHVGRVPELLAPAGGPKEFRTALAAGADAIYCGFGNTFNARRGAESFTSQTFAAACRLAHIAGARVYVTVNVAIRDDEMPTVLGLVRRAWLLGADAFIIQDWGLLHEVRRLWPEVECHVSTQANVHDARGVAWCAALGVSRVTLSRELSLPEIERIAREGVELECFCHGAICFCYSGICKMSSCSGSRSANRGMCAQPCRLPYDVVDEKGSLVSDPERGRPLCPKDFYAFEDLPSMADAGVASLKVEGRLKGPDYIFAVIGTYRQQLDDLAEGREVAADELEARRTRLKRAFNRDFTNAYLMGTSGDELMSYERSNNRGELVGEVVDARSYGSMKVRRGGGRGGRDRVRTVTVAEVDVRLDKFVGEGDLLELRPLSDPAQFLTASAEHDALPGDVLVCQTPRVVERGSRVRVIRSQEAMTAGANASRMETPRKRPVRVRVRALLGRPFEVCVATEEGICATAIGPEMEPARTRAITEQDIVEHVGRMGGTAFEPTSFEVLVDEGCGMGFSAMHAVRAQACETLERMLLEPYEHRQLEQAPSRVALRDRLGATPCVDAVTEVCALVADAESAHVARAAGATRVYASADALAEGSWPDDVIPLLDEVCREGDHERLDAWVRRDCPVAVGNVSELALAHECSARAEIRGCIPVHNAVCLHALVDAGACGVWLSSELSLPEIQTLGTASPVPLGFMVAGRARAMTSEHCVLQAANHCVHDCRRCVLRRRRLFLQSGAGDRFPVRTDIHGRSRIYSAQETDATPEIPDLLAAGVRWFGADCTLLSPAETRRVVEHIARAVRAAREGRRPQERRAGATPGHLHEPIR